MESTHCSWLICCLSYQKRPVGKNASRSHTPYNNLIQLSLPMRLGQKSWNPVATSASLEKSCMKAFILCSKISWTLQPPNCLLWRDDFERKRGSVQRSHWVSGPPKQTERRLPLNLTTHEILGGGVSAFHTSRNDVNIIRPQLFIASYF